MKLEDIELAAHITGTNPVNQQEVEDALWERYEVDLSNFSNLASDLLKCTIPQKAPLSEQLDRVFARQNLDKPGVYIALLKCPAIIG